MKKLFLLSAICIAFLGNEETQVVDENTGVPGETPEETKKLNMEALNEETPVVRDEEFDDDDEDDDDFDDEDDDFDDDIEDDFDEDDLDNLEDLEDNDIESDDDDDIFDDDDDVD